MTNGPMSSRRAGLTLVVGLIAVVLGLILSSGPFGSLASMPSPRTSAQEAPAASAVPGDLDCDADIDVVDALLILRIVAALATVSDCGASDVNCSGRTDAVDALALLREMARLSPMTVPDGCPGLDHEKLKLFVEIDRLSCEPPTVGLGQATDCYYSVTSSGEDHELSWDFSGGVAFESVPAILGLSCPPDNLPCTFATAGTQSVTFLSSGKKTITLTACAMGSCDSATQAITLAAE